MFHVEVGTMGEITVHFDREWKDDIIRMDYKWEDEKGAYVITDIPCEHLPFGNNDYLSDKVSIVLEMIMDLQKTGEIHNKFSFISVENLVNEWELD
jgi:hypothetical protein